MAVCKYLPKKHNTLLSVDCPVRHRLELAEGSLTVRRPNIDTALAAKGGLPHVLFRLEPMNSGQAGASFRKPRDAFAILAASRLSPGKVLVYLKELDFFG
jgi:hypothetical protein